MSKITYVSTDIEADGPIPGDFSMLSFGSAAFNESGELISTFTRNLELLPNAYQHEDTIKWWADNQEAYEATRVNTIDPYTAMVDYSEWLYGLPGKPIFVGYPAGFDFTFIYWYLIHFTGKSPFSFSCLDMKSFACALMGTKFTDTVKRTMPKEWFSNKHKHTHQALDDAIEQGHLFIKMLGHR